MFRVIYDNDGSFTLSDEGETVYVQGNNDTVQGGRGADQIATLLRDDEPSGISTSLSGGQGDDTLQAALTLDAGGYSDEIGELSGTLSGGQGNDVIEVSTSALHANQSVAVTGGAGADTIDVNVDIRDPSGSYSSFAGSSVDVDGGAGVDRISISVAGGGSAGATARGGGGDDRIEVASGAAFDAGSSENTIYGDEGNDTIIARSSGSGDYGAGTNRAWGGTGDDSMDLSATDNFAYGEGGADTLRLEASSVWEVSNYSEGGNGADKLTLIGNSGGWIDGGVGTNEAHGGDGDDVLSARLNLSPAQQDGEPGDRAGSGHNLVYGGAGNDRISARIDTPDPSGGNFFSELYGGAGNDRLSVRGGEGNILNGGAGNDTLIGGSGSDTLIGLQGDDALQGKGGADIFLFGFIRSGERDRIADFVIGEDVIDLSQIDANRDRAGEQSFRFGTREGTGRAWIEEDPDTTGSILYADDGHRVLEVLLKDGRGVSAEDYSAGDFLL